ncbi:hypothetical protein PtrV1_02718 [Pyrenophora tritici-repentis]|uniref:Uncharacterized protein n=1 Tax=Pyrenophora tritici-repentis TaxID=45151 RepID=A0A5M9LSR1_9PLEO|nr:hypothetical protein PtrV1_02718 [Pyrenophora tritici-repentis]KAF7455480.1 hypothetical protein A1F99_027380 [Pyrenophora tritici-repentis]KAI1517654.1 hypothetical protein Ptr86124_002955 [Pyrenophora tritici-repentis]KAI1689523.1 hypothetical protein KJE20_02701 [Pyrenophora tritici-repentis]
MAYIMNPRTLRDLSNTIFNLNYSSYLFSSSTIFDSRSALYFTDNQDLLVLGTYKKCLDYLIVKASTQSFLVLGDLFLKKIMIIKEFVAEMDFMLDVG